MWVHFEKVTGMKPLFWIYTKAQHLSNILGAHHKIKIIKPLTLRAKRVQFPSLPSSEYYLRSSVASPRNCSDQHKLPSQNIPLPNILPLPPNTRTHKYCKWSSASEASQPPSVWLSRWALVSKLVLIQLLLFLTPRVKKVRHMWDYKSSLLNCFHRSLKGHGSQLMQASKGQLAFGGWLSKSWYFKSEWSQLLHRHPSPSSEINEALSTQRIFGKLAK